MDRYSVLKVIGEGSFGRALLVQTKHNGEKLVLKELRLPKGRVGMESSRREAVLLSKMKHLNIVAFKDSFEGDGCLYIVMEFCSGGDLLQRIKDQKKTLFPEDLILQWFTQMCLAVQHIHDKRVLHRDLKSKNIFLTDSGIVKVGDFGSACVLNSAKGFAQTYVGTPYYVSPEIWDNQPYNNKSDVWSLGCVLYELCTLRHPFQARSWKALILLVCRGAYAPLPPHLPYEMHYLIKHMFKTNPRDRPSVRTILDSHRVSRLLRKHVNEQESRQEELEEEKQEEEQERRQRWRREEGGGMAAMLGQKSLLTNSTAQGTFTEAPEAEDRSSNRGPRKRWAAGPSQTVLEALGNAEVMSCGSTASTEGRMEERMEQRTEERTERRRWDRAPPERLLSLLEKAHLSTAFQTYTIHRAGPLGSDSADDTDGPEQLTLDPSRLEARSDDEDTDFEEDYQHDWIDGLEKMVEEHEQINC